MVEFSIFCTLSSKSLCFTPKLCNIIAQLPQSSLLYAPTFLCGHCITFCLSSFPLLHYSRLIFVLSSSMLFASLVSKHSQMLRLYVHFLCHISLETCHSLFVFVCLGLEFLLLGQLWNSTFDPILFIIFFFMMLVLSSSRSLDDKHIFNNPCLFSHYIPFSLVQFF